MRADINTIARECGVSKATVSRVFTGKASVSAEVREKILKVASELNYTPQQVAARETIVIVVNSLNELEENDGFRTLLLIKLVGEITRSGFLVNIIEAKDVDKVLTSYTKAAVILLNDTELLAHKEKISGMKMPLIAIGNVLDNCHSISFDYYSEISVAVEFLVKNGHKKISLMLDNPIIMAGKERLRGYTETLEKYGLAPMPIYEHCFGEQPLIELMATMLQDQPTAMIICGESISNEAVYALNLLQVKVPTDLSIISFEKRDSSRWFSPPHTTVVQDAREMVSETMVLVRDIIKKCPKENYSKQLPCKLKIRNSVRRLCG